MSALYIGAGINHFVNATGYLQIMPPWLPEPLALVYISGVAEIICGLFVLPLGTRKVAAWALIALLIAVFPANIQMSLNYYRSGHPYFWLSILRLPLQVLLVWWAWKFTRKSKLRVFG